MHELQSASNLKQWNPAIKSKGFEFVQYSEGLTLSLFLSNGLKPYDNFKDIECGW